MRSTEQKKQLHPRNVHNTGYDFQKLIRINPALKDYIVETVAGTTSIDFADPASVVELNKGLLKQYYKIDQWTLPKNSLCPPIPGRADYIHYLADLLASEKEGQIPTGEDVRILDIGTGASCIYPILGQRIYQWSFVGTDIDESALNHAQSIAKSNGGLKKQIELRFQPDNKKIFDGVLNKADRFDAVMCNPPFFKSREDNWQKTSKKFNNLNKRPDKHTVQNFAGHPNELWCEGGERQFVRTMIYESMNFKNQLGWITTLISDKDNLKPLIAVLEYNKAAKVEVIGMQHGNKIIRILAWKW
ncbi:23S rRNA (adenine(1618)-N(6))-methyltransferase RlmF [Sphingobacterium psychroaquaticum]|uniref:Ribosomal RNA large subunit methyltransferase F n=1 Tax=Sphingobacterium psychroaquaticum TaxID=561061 RepID=A0A1X7JP38_9SPHI|nr:23S rRNA (adenine(1618)-N(6))-methyltransferase RlmF [Sphingobacterium psychroaquaticum]QBQ40901.1 23S rRNA (adenine(1618)-N(6))-methyltransferase RlmF [Sphingobacterium psychroaquaticum]SMG29677.1 23S rRNA (adenine1618-N6)-methyltransferase [Sphingobacterium psychroaquaticum]